MGGEDIGYNENGKAGIIRKESKIGSMWIEGRGKERVEDRDRGSNRMRNRESKAEKEGTFRDRRLSKEWMEGEGQGE